MCLTPNIRIIIKRSKSGRGGRKNLTTPVSRESLLRESIKFPSNHIGFELFIPTLRIILCEPPPEFSQFIRVELLHSLFDFKNTRHKLAL